MRMGEWVNKLTLGGTSRFMINAFYPRLVSSAIWWDQPSPQIEAFTCYKYQINLLRSYVLWGALTAVPFSSAIPFRKICCSILPCFSYCLVTEPTLYKMIIKYVWTDIPGFYSYMCVCVCVSVCVFMWNDLMQRTDKAL